MTYSESSDVPEPFDGVIIDGDLHIPVATRLELNSNTAVHLLIDAPQDKLLVVVLSFKFVNMQSLRMVGSGFTTEQQAIVVTEASPALMEYLIRIMTGRPVGKTDQRQWMGEWDAFSIPRID